ncbi:MAG: ORF6N domain-containing protein [Ignavibacteriae bacterium]|nr:ORF6N domain-containing protein [Ignavibacteriota bacterium]
MSDKIKNEEEKSLVTQKNIKRYIYSIRDRQVMLDRDLAELYGVPTKRLNEQVKRNIERFPSDFMFQLTKDELKHWRSQFATSNSEKMGLRRSPYVFTEYGVSMLASILKSKPAIDVSIKIIRTFVEMRKFLATNAQVFQRLENVETKLLTYQIKSDEKFEKVFKALEDKSITPKQGIFYNGQVFDAYTLVADIIRTAKKSIILINNYVDDTVLNLFTKRKKNVKTTIYTKTISKVLKQDLEKHNEQYESIQIKILKTAHNRFLIVDEKTIYHFGASLKDLGKKWFAFSKLEMEAKEIIDKL